MVGQKIFDAHFPLGSRAPAVITAETGAIPQVIAAVSKVAGVSTAPGSVCVGADYAKLAQLAKTSVPDRRPRVRGAYRSSWPSPPVLPLVFLSEVGFAVAFGVPLDTIVVRSILVPALSHDLGKRIWWPSSLARTAD